MNKEKLIEIHESLKALTADHINDAISAANLYDSERDIYVEVGNIVHIINQLTAINRRLLRALIETSK